MKDNIQKMFDNIAPNYDKLNDIISLGRHLSIKKQAIKNANIKSDYKVLDVCCGTGDIAIYLAKHVLKKGHVIGVDFSQKMLEIAERKTNAANINFVRADALSLPFNDKTFDACFISFGLRNLSNLKQGLLEMKRVTKDGGLVVNLDTGKPKGIINFFFKFFFFNIVPLFGKIFNKDSGPYKYLPQSTKEFPSQDELVKIFEELGLKNVRKYDFLFGSISEQIGEV